MWLLIFAKLKLLRNDWIKILPDFLSLFENLMHLLRDLKLRISAAFSILHRDPNSGKESYLVKKKGIKTFSPFNIFFR